jgi:glycosyltransferase involved in cell wall biosynthesis
MDVCFTSHRYEPLVGGYENQLKLLAENLSEFFNVRVVTFKLTNSPDFECLNRVEVHRVTPKLVFFRVPFSASYIKMLSKMNFDILHAHGFVPIVSDLSVLYAKSKKKTAVYTHHFDGNVQDSTALNPLADFYNRTVGRFSVGFADAIVATSKSYAETSQVIKHHLGKVHVIPCFVDCNSFEPQPASKVIALKEQLGLEGKKIALFVGRIVPYKGLEHLVRALDRIKNEMDEEFHLLLIGEGEGRNISDQSEYYHSIRRLVTEGSLEGCVHFLGRVQSHQLPMYYSLADVVALPSVMRGEAFGTVLLEALACGTPVIASSISGVKEVLKGNNSIGSYVPPRDHFALSNAIVKKAYQKDDITEQCREFVLDNYRAEKIVKKYVDLYSSLN